MLLNSGKRQVVVLTHVQFVRLKMADIEVYLIEGEKKHKTMFL